MFSLKWNILKGSLKMYTLLFRFYIEYIYIYGKFKQPCLYNDTDVYAGRGYFNEGPMFQSKVGLQ